MALRQKLLNVMTECAHIGKDGYNSFHKYPYVTAAKMNDIINAALVKNGIVTTSKTTLLEMREVETVSGKKERNGEPDSASGKKERLATVSVEITLYDVDSEETMVIGGVGSGQDANDKGVAKAQTMATKYAWKSTLLVADASDDPDYDGSTFVPTDRPGGNPTGKPTSAPNGSTNGWSGDGKKIVGKCEKCGKDVSEKSAYYSHRSFGEHLYCYDCQQKLRASKSSDSKSAPF